MIVLPFVAGADQDTVALPFPRTALGFGGADGGPTGVTGADVAEGVLVPTPLVATTLNVYGVPSASVPTVHCRVVSDAGEQVSPPGEAITV